MRSRLIVLLITIVISIPLSATTYYVSTTGNDGGSGTLTSPWATWHYAFGKLNPGDILYIRGGIYKTSGILSGGTYVGARIAYKKATSANMILISAYNNEVPVLDCSGLTHSGWKVGIYVDGCSYIRFKGLTVQNVNEHGETSYPADGWVGGSSNHITMEQCTVTRCGGGFSFGKQNDYIYYTNCDSYNNCDLLFGAVSSGGIGGYANGFTCSISAGMHAFFEGCRAWNNSDDGYDNMGGAGYITYKNCWAFENGHTTGDWTNIIGDGDGFKLGLTPAPKEAGVQRTCTNCVAWSNDLGGFDESQDRGPVCDMVLYNCTAYSNKRSGFGFYTTEGGYTGIATLKNCIAYKNDIDGGYKQNYNLRSSCVLSNNSWQKGTVTDADFVSLTSTAAKGARKSDGSLPDINFLHLATGSFLIDAGVNVGLPYSGNSPDIGAFETQPAAAVVVPLYVSALVANTAPAVVELTFNANLANIAPSAASFPVSVNSAAVSVSSVSISGTKVKLTLQNPVKFGDVITVSYNQPAVNQLQGTTGGKVASFSNKSVKNNISEIIIPDTISITLNNDPLSYSGYVYELNPVVGSKKSGEVLTYHWDLPDSIPVSSRNDLGLQFLAPVVQSLKSLEFKITVSNGTDSASQIVPIDIVPYKPDTQIATIKKIEGSSYESIYFPKNAVDNNISSLWSASGDNQWLNITLLKSFKISHIEIAFLKDQMYSSFFDIYASKDSVNWIPVLMQKSSCNFSGGLQVFDFPDPDEEYICLKYVGHGNSSDGRNNISELKVFGTPAIQSEPVTANVHPTIYPNPVKDHLNISFRETMFKPDKIRIIDYSGKIILEQRMPEYENFIQIPVSIKSGVYILALGTNNNYSFFQQLVVL